MNPLICDRCCGQMIKTIVEGLYECEECGRCISIEKIHSSE